MIYTVYSKNPVESCPFCVNAIALLKEKGANFTVKKVGEDFTRDWLIANFPSMKTYPVVTATFPGGNPKSISDTITIGGYTELKAYYDAKTR